MTHHNNDKRKWQQVPARRDNFHSTIITKLAGANFSLKTYKVVNVC